MNFIKKILIEAEEEYHGSMGAGVLPFAKDSKKFLVGLRSDECNEPYTWGIFGGAVELHKSETIQLAAQRELKEEIRFSGSMNLIVGYVYKDGRFKYHNFIGIVETEFKPRLNWEHDDAKWLTYEELLKLPKKHYGLIAFLKNSRKIFQSLIDE